MSWTLTGTLQGSTILLDEVESAAHGETPIEESQRVKVVVEPLDDADLVLTPEQQARLLVLWAREGPQGPIEAGGGD